MRKWTALAALTALWMAPALASQLEMTVNGAFEEPVSTGWNQNITGSYMYLERSTGLDLDPDYEVRLYTNNGSGDATLWQRLPLPSTATVFSADLRSSARDGNGAWCAAGLRIRYLDAFGAILGQSFLGSLSPACPWTGDGAFHVVEVGEEWQTLSFVIADELANLPDVDPAMVRQLEAALVVSAANC